MNTAIEQLKSEMTALPAEDRAELAHFLIQSLETQTDEGIEAAWDEELSRRADEIRSGQASFKAAEQVFAETRSKHS